MKIEIEMTDKMLSDNYEVLDEMCYIQRDRLARLMSLPISKREIAKKRLAFLKERIESTEVLLTFFRGHLTVLSMGD